MVRANPGLAPPLVMRELARQWNEHKAALAAGGVAAAGGGAPSATGHRLTFDLTADSPALPRQHAVVDLRAEDDGGGADDAVEEV